jgi:hypothetical protein
MLKSKDHYSGRYDPSHSFYRKYLTAAPSASPQHATIHPSPSSNTTSANFLALPLDVTSKQSIDAAFDAALKKFSRVDVIVNNAGDGLAGCFEELSDEQIRQQMEVNYFGLIDVTIQTMREQTPSGGLIQQVTSIGAKGACRRSASTACPSGRSKGLRRRSARKSSRSGGSSSRASSPVDSGPIGAVARCTLPNGTRHMIVSMPRQNMKKRYGTQAGDPRKGARVMYEFAVMEDPPLRVVIGTDAYASIMEKIKQYEENYKKISNSTDVDDK